MECHQTGAFFCCIAPTAQKLGYHLRELEAQMGQYDGVDHYCEAVGTRGKRHRFCVSQMLTEVDVWEESSDLVLPF